MPQIPSYPPAVLPMSGNEAVPIWQSGRQKSVPMSEVANNSLNISKPYIDRLKTRAISPTTDLGAIGDGAHATQDQAGILASFTAIAASRSATPTGSLDLYQYQNGMEIEPGIYDAGDFSFADGKSWLKARIPGTVFIRIPAGKYFLTVTGQLIGLYWDGIVFLGGKGALKLTRTGTNASQNMRITNCIFGNYTECAISNNSVDSPFLKVDNSTFSGASTANCGIAWGGYVDQLVIENCAITGNDYGIAIGPRLSGNYNIQKNDLLQNRKADIWIKPNITDSGGTNAGHGSIIKQCKFGNELQTVGAPYPRILIANEDTTSGTDRATYKPLTSGTGSADGYLALPTIRDNRLAHISPYNAPVIRSYITNVQYGLWDNNKFVGGTPTYVMEFPNGFTPYYVNTNSHFIFRAGDGNVPIQFSTHPFGRLEDHACFWLGTAGSATVHPLSDDPTLSPVGAALSGYEMGYGSGTTSVAAADPYGTTDYAAVTGLAFIGFTDPYGGAGGAMFAEVSLSKAASNSLSYVVVDVVNYANSNYAVQRTVALPANGAPAKVSIPLILSPNASPGTWQFRVYGSGVVAGSADTFVVGDMIISKGNGRLGRDRALSARFPLASRNPRLLGGAAATLPTGWSMATNVNGLAGITATVNRVGVDRYAHFVEIAFGGACTAAGQVAILAEVAKALGLESGNAWRGLFGLRLMSGDWSAFTSSTAYDGTTGPVAISFPCYSSAGAWLIQRGMNVTPTTAYKAFGRTFTSGFFHASGDYMLPSIGFSFAVGAAPNAVVRIYAPILQRVQ